MENNWKSITDPEKQVKMVKAQLKRQYFGELENLSIDTDALLDNAKNLMIMNYKTEQDMLRGEKPDSQYTPRINALNRTLNDLKRMRETGICVDQSKD